VIDFSRFLSGPFATQAEEWTLRYEIALRTIQDASQDYLAVVDTLLADAEIREVDVAV
jgi:hypothetical protein